MDRKVALITGGSRGIGKGIAMQLAKEGYAIAVVGTRDEETVNVKIQELKEISTEFMYIKGDIGSGEDRKRICDSCLEYFGRIDMLVNNAGVAPKKRMDILETTEESMDFVLNINLKGSFFLTQYVAKKMIELVNQKKIKNPKIVNISSVSAYTSSTNRAEYCMSKAGMSMITTLFADKLSQYGINTYEIRPGIIKTDMTSKVKDKYDKLFAQGLTPINRWGYPEDVGKVVLAIAKGYMDYSTGEVINVDGGFNLKRL